MAKRTLPEFKECAAQASQFMLMFGNEKRLLLLCELRDAGEMSVTALADSVELSQSALSQHLAKLRALGLVATRRDAQTIYYRVAPDDRVKAMLDTLEKLFCR